MSQHNIVGSEAFDTRPSVMVRSFKPGGIRRRKARTALAFAAGAVVALIAGAVATAVALGPTVFG
ncbi:MAG: hypothetical protein EON91_08750 [Brevundimonas sp.]|uniref:hypothetical protein n=1 Tax=Brevundimonas sp. TaxID=1871086 RepID=UPI00120034F3|nr:hypothetical protein [Brevundimonas sp.]RZJ17586.1 MAG: hypothetical protein EON91_08750 [Brevundimonas sp.]